MDKNLVLIVDDNQRLATDLSDTLENSEGLLTEWYQSGNEALHRLDESTPSIMILDLHLPDLSGIELIKEIKRRPHLSSMDVIVITGDSIRMEMAEEQVDLALVKPVNTRHVGTLVQRFIQS